MQKFLLRSITYILFVLFLAGCGTAQTSQTDSDEDYSLTETSLQEDISEDQSEIPVSFMIEDEENYIAYQTGAECAAFASAYLLRHYGVDASGIELYKSFPDKISEDGGVYPQGIVNFFIEKEYSAEFVKDATVEELKKEIARGAPVIVFIHGKYPYESVHDTHYVPIIGYDESYFYFAESAEGLANCKDENQSFYNRKTDIETFEKLWGNIEGIWQAPYFLISPPDKG